MQISGIGGAGLGGGAFMGIGSLGGASAATSGLNVTANGVGVNISANGQGLDVASIPANLQGLVQTMQDFSSAEILIALMMLASASKDDEEGSSGAAGFLAGMALAGGLGQSSNGDLTLTSAEFPGIGLVLDSSASLNLNITA